jgi:hypothetical protein
MSSDNTAGPLAVRVFSVHGGAKLPARARRAESDLDVLQHIQNNLSAYTTFHDVTLRGTTLITEGIINMCKKSSKQYMA